ncbi:cation diffusion facilitator family transporter [Rhodopirellula sp. MGV]|uniref:cation diffusion facilitator family transporter n=1 Tax=Rhodopirellula sp. MGV TaxID=2023130 RepID=UPI000B965099|nr:cation diffusion facilitator family transporter [Rhodopirellula sp. MGV]OYP38189.1 cation-efflux pump [Rhodopirellula sp. MGV]PNY38522.1 cation transporter [Rhodopirellula baltica]
MTAEEQAIRATWFSIIANVCLALVKGTAGVLGNSFALVADAIESTADILASCLVLFGITYARQPADENHPYGHGRIEPLITFVVVGFLITSASIIAWESLRNIRTPHELPESWTLIVLGAIIAWKELSYRIVIQKSRETGSTALQADAWHHRSDAITSVAAFVGISIALFMGPGYETADDWAALFASGFIVYNSYLIFRPALGEIMDEHLYDEMVDEIRQHCKDVPRVIDTEKCFVRKTGMYYLADLHVIVDGAITVDEGHEIAHQVKDHLLSEISQLRDLQIHIEPANADHKIPGRGALATKQ